MSEQSNTCRPTLPNGHVFNRDAKFTIIEIIVKRYKYKNNNWKKEKMSVKKKKGKKKKETMELNGRKNKSNEDYKLHVVYPSYELTAKQILCSLRRIFLSWCTMKGINLDGANEQKYHSCPDYVCIIYYSYSNKHVLAYIFILLFLHLSHICISISYTKCDNYHRRVVVFFFIQVVYSFMG